MFFTNTQVKQWFQFKVQILKKENEQVFVESGGIYVLKEERFLMKAQVIKK